MSKQFLYRFIRPPGDNKTYRDRLRQLVEHNQVRLSLPSQLNDPFDCKTLFSTAEATRHDLDDFAESTIVRYGGPAGRSIANYALRVVASDPARWIKQLHFRYTQFHMAELDKNGILCFFEPPREDMPTDILMWSHYADGHRGFCIQFNKQVLKENFICKPIQYHDKYPTLKEVASAESDEQLAELFLFRKSIRWAYESEWRLLLPLEHTRDGVLQLPPNALSGIIFGCDVDPTDREDITVWAHHRCGKSIAIHQAKKDAQRYSIIIEELVEQPRSEKGSSLPLT